MTESQRLARNAYHRAWDARNRALARELRRVSARKARQKARRERLWRSYAAAMEKLRHGLCGAFVGLIG
jgi:hypothetical protein